MLWRQTLAWHPLGLLVHCLPATKGRKWIICILCYMYAAPMDVWNDLCFYFITKQCMVLSKLTSTRNIKHKNKTRQNEKRDRIHPQDAVNLRSIPLILPAGLLVGLWTSSQLHPLCHGGQLTKIYEFHRFYQNKTPTYLVAFNNIFYWEFIMQLKSPTQARFSTWAAISMDAPSSP